MSGLLLRLARVLLVALGCAQAHAASVCTVTALPVAFGNYNPQAIAANTSTGSVTVVCQPVVASATQIYTLRMSTGSSANYAQRTMLAGANNLNYQLYSDAGYTQVWGNGSGASSTVSGSLPLSVLVPVSATHTVYGRLPAAQTQAGAGSYLDTITVTVTY